MARITTQVRPGVYVTRRHHPILGWICALIAGIAGFRFIVGFLVTHWTVALIGAIAAVAIWLAVRHRPNA